MKTAINVTFQLPKLQRVISEIHHKVFIYVYLQFKSEFKENYLASTSLLMIVQAVSWMQEYYFVFLW